jgi:four helix bundle protein
MQNVQCKMQNAEDAHNFVSVRSMGSRPARTYDLGERFLDFADRVICVVEALPETRIGRRIADQLLRSGTSPLGNYEEACAAESKRDFCHKMRVCLKEIRESRAWLRLIGKRALLPSNRLDSLVDESAQLAKIIGRSIATAKGIQKKNKVGITMS